MGWYKQHIPSFSAEHFEEISLLFTLSRARMNYRGIKEVP